MSCLEKLSVADLLKQHARVADELRGRGILRSANNPAGDLAECLFCRAFGWRQAPNSERGFDAMGADGMRYQIKARRMHRRGSSRQLSAIRNLGAEHFDVLAAMLFAADYGVMRAALVPRAIVEKRAHYTGHTNSHRFMLQDDVWNEDGVRDVTADLRAVSL